MDRSLAVDAIRRALVARYPIIGLVSWEEERVESTLRELARTGFSGPAKLFTWASTTGLVGPDGPIADTLQPVKALDAVAAAEEPSVFLFRDLHQPLESDDLLQRRLRDLRRELTGKFKF